jgi:hypothetical protein
VPALRAAGYEWLAQRADSLLRRKMICATTFCTAKNIFAKPTPPRYKPQGSSAPTGARKGKN